MLTSSQVSYGAPTAVRLWRSTRKSIGLAITTSTVAAAMLTTVRSNVQYTPLLNSGDVGTGDLERCEALRRSRCQGSVVSTSVGYANGCTENPIYEEVCHNDTGHAETVMVEYDPSNVSLTFLLEHFYDAIDPTSLNRQGGDAGTQYRTGVYYSDETDKDIILGSLTLLQESFDKPVMIEAAPLNHYYSAEEYHQKYLDKNPGGYCHIGGAKFERARQAVDEATLYRPKEKVSLVMPKYTRCQAVFGTIMTKNFLTHHCRDKANGYALRFVGAT